MKKRVEKLFNNKFVLSVFVIFILGVIIISGPANAFIGEIIIPFESKEVIKGDVIKLNTEIGLEDGDFLDDVILLSFNLRGPEPISRKHRCDFFVNGTIKNVGDNCKGINVELMNSSDVFGYSYSYASCVLSGYSNDCKINYSILIDSNEYFSGEYETEFIINTKGKRIFTSGENIKIIADNLKDFKRCSVRALDGSLTLNNKNFSNNKLSFYISTNLDRDRVRGRGSISGQKDRERFSFRFNVVDVLENDLNHSLLLVSGKLRIGRDNNKEENAIIFIDKLTDNINIEGESLKIDTMYINFRKDC
ncbi:hypothetical protein GOV12_00615 [Candidatus Pacearchaeota archaeon]|nr:hypothetical protein [Candidatus Pacearchaeota archaeon]